MRLPPDESSSSGEMGSAESLRKTSADIMEGSGTQPIDRGDLGHARATHTSVPEDFPGRGEPQGGVFIALSYAQRSNPTQRCWCWGVGPLWRCDAQGPFTIGAVFVLTEESCVALGSASRFPETPSYTN